LRLVRAGEEVREATELILANVRTPDVRRGDLRAQTAANRLAERRLGELIERRGRDVVLAAVAEVRAYDERRTSEASRAVPAGTRPWWRATSRPRSAWPTPCCWRCPTSSTCRPRARAR